MEVNLTLLSVITAQPCDIGTATGFWAMYRKGEGHVLRPVAAWGVCQAKELSKHVKPLVLDRNDCELVPADALPDFIGIVEPGDELLLAETAEASSEPEQPGK